MILRTKLNGQKLAAATYDEAEQVLVIEFYDKSSTRFKRVPREVYQRLSQAPNAQAYFEDRIADEYPQERGTTTPSPDARKKLDDLFG
jgi:hypothetical protein